MGTPIIVNVEGVIRALQDQRNVALDDNAKLYALVSDKDAEITRLKDELKKISASVGERTEYEPINKDVKNVADSS